MRKLLKYEMKALSRGLLPLYGAVLVVALVNRIFAFFQQPVHLDGFPLILVSMGLYVGLIVAVAVMTLIVIVQRFYKGLLCDEGYLMFTLPVRPGQLILSKLIGACIMTVCSVVVGFVSVLILLSSVPFWQSFLEVPWGRAFIEAFRAMPSWPLLVIEVLVLLLLGAARSVLGLYLPMALGHQAKNHRVAMSVVWYIAISTALSALGVLVTGIGTAMNFDYYLSRLLFALPDALSAHLTFLSMIAVTLIMDVLFYLATRYLLTRRLNLE